MTTPVSLEGIQFPLAADGQRSTTSTNKAIYSAALEALHPQAAQALRDERDWRKHYPTHLRMLTEVGIINPAHALQIATTGLAAAWQQFEFMRNERTQPFADAMRLPQPDTLHTVEMRGRGSPTIAPWTLPYRGKNLAGNELRAQIARWEAQQIIEPSHGRALRTVMEHPEWFDLSDRTLVLLGAAAEAGPLATLARWRANIVAIDLPDAATWYKILSIISQGNARLIAPVRQPVAPNTPPDQWATLAGADLLTQTPEIAAWLAALASPLDIAALAYLDGERHARVSLAMDGVMASLCATQPATTLMYMATPTDIFAVHESTARAAMARYAQRGMVERIGAAVGRLLSGGRFLRPHIAGLITSSNGKRYGIADSIVIEQGPNYALAKRIQQWRALVARAAGHRVAVNVAPATLTQSVIKNPALKAGYKGASLFNIEVFAPETTSALMAALWVYDLRCTNCAADPNTALDHPLELLIEGANHSGLWRARYLPRTALPLAALVGYARG